MLAIVLLAGPHHCQPSASCSTHLSRLNGGSSPLPALCFLYYICLLHHLLHLQHHLPTKHLAESLETSVVLAEEQTSFPALMRIVLCGSYLIFLQSHFGLRPESWILWALPYYIVSKGQRRCEKHIVDKLQFNSPPGRWKGTHHIAMSQAGHFASPRQVVMLALTFSRQSWLELERGLDLFEKSLTQLSLFCQDTSMIMIWFWISKVKDAQFPKGKPCHIWNWFI